MYKQKYLNLLITDMWSIAPPWSSSEIALHETRLTWRPVWENWFQTLMRGNENPELISVENGGKKEKENLLFAPKRWIYTREKVRGRKNNSWKKCIDMEWGSIKKNSSGKFNETSSSSNGESFVIRERNIVYRSQLNAFKAFLWPRWHCQLGGRENWHFLFAKRMLQIFPRLVIVSGNPFNKRSLLTHRCTSSPKQKRLRTLEFE